MIRALLVIVSLTSLAQDAQAHVVIATLLCPDGQKIIKQVECEPGDVITTYGTCTDGKLVTDFRVCPRIQYPVADWGFGFGGAYLDATDNGGPSPAGVEVSIFGNLRVARDWLWLHGEAAPGTMNNGEAWYPTLSEFIGAEFRVGDRFAIDLGARHRVMFYADGDKVNAIMGALQARVQLWDGLNVIVGAAFGKAWFPVMETSSSWDPQTKYTTKTTAPVVAYGFAQSYTFALSYSFF